MDHSGPLLCLLTHTAIPTTGEGRRDRPCPSLRRTQERRLILTADVNVRSKRILALIENMFLLAETIKYLTNPFVLTFCPGKVTYLSLPLITTTGKLAQGQTATILIISAHFGPGYNWGKTPGFKENHKGNRHVRIQYDPGISRKVRNMLLFADFQAGLAVGTSAWHCPLHSWSPLSSQSSIFFALCLLELSFCPILFYVISDNKTNHLLLMMPLDFQVLSPEIFLNCLLQLKYFSPFPPPNYFLQHPLYRTLFLYFHISVSLSLFIFFALLLGDTYIKKMKIEQ